MADMEDVRMSERQYDDAMEELIRARLRDVTDPKSGYVSRDQASSRPLHGDGKRCFHLSVYLVTGRDLLPPGMDYYKSLDESLRDGNVSIVQIREKHVETSEYLEIAKRSLEICDKYRVRMMINDNLAVALALPGRVGLHIGQTDLSPGAARQLLGDDRILGLSVHSVEEAEVACKAPKGQIQYVGIGPVYGTQSKAGIGEDDVLGIANARKIDRVCYEAGMPRVLIGGINQKRAARALFGIASGEDLQPGLAVISAIVSRRDPGKAAAEMAAILNAQREVFWMATQSTKGYMVVPFNGVPLASLQLSRVVNDAAAVLTNHRSGRCPPPLIQTLTSHVSSTLSANIALAFGASPIMSHQKAEADDLGKVTGAVVLNIGTIGEEARRGMRAVGQAANLGGKPVLLDPVGVGASSFRKEVVREIMEHTQVTLIKGNAAELSAIAGLNEVQSRGVDSGSGSLTDPEGLVLKLSRQERCLVLMTGKVDYLCDGIHVVKIFNGHDLLGRITGSGCALGVMMATGMAAACNSSVGPRFQSKSQTMVNVHEDKLFYGALLGVLAMTIASEVAAARSDVKGPGSFIPALIDEVANISPETIVSKARIEIVSH